MSAAAGSGKTAVLVERIVRRITEEGGDIDRLLVVTFTEAAAAQMRDRIMEAIEDRLAERPGDAHLSRQLLLLPRASIATLHSFCFNVVRQHFYTLGLDPNVRVMDEQRSALDPAGGAGRGVGGRVRPAWTRTAPSRDWSTRTAGRSGDETLQRLMLALHDYARSLPDPYGWLREAGRAYATLEEATFDETPWARELLLHVKVAIAARSACCERALALAHGPGGAAAHAETIESDIERLQRLRDAAEDRWSALAGRGRTGAVSAGEDGQKRRRRPGRQGP